MVMHVCVFIFSVEGAVDHFAGPWRRELLLESKLSRATDEMRSPDSQKPGVAASSEELFAQLREKLLTPTTRSEERGREEG